MAHHHTYRRHIDCPPSVRSVTWWVTAAPISITQCVPLSGCDVRSPSWGSFFFPIVWPHGADLSTDLPSAVTDCRRLVFFDLLCRSSLAAGLPVPVARFPQPSSHRRERRLSAAQATASADHPKRPIVMSWISSCRCSEYLAGMLSTCVQTRADDDHNGRLVQACRPSSRPGRR